MANLAGRGSSGLSVRRTVNSYLVLFARPSDDRKVAKVADWNTIYPLPNMSDTRQKTSRCTPANGKVAIMKTQKIPWEGLTKSAVSHAYNLAEAYTVRRYRKLPVLCPMPSYMLRPTPTVHVLELGTYCRPVLDAKNSPFALRSTSGLVLARSPPGPHGITAN